MKKHTITSIIYLLSFLLCSTNLMAQDVSIEGRVVYEKTGEPVPYCSIQLKDVAIGTVTNYRGYFSIKVPANLPNKVLLFSYVGLKPQIFSLGNFDSSQRLLIKMAESSTMLKEVVIKYKKDLSVKKVLKNALANIPKNYSQKPVVLEGYYREALKESGAFIQYGDAISQIYCLPYQGEPYKFKSLRKMVKSTGFKWDPVFNRSFGNWGVRLHDHFIPAINYPALPNDHEKIIASRSAMNLSQHRLDAHIENGPVGLAGKNIVRVLDLILEKPKDYDWEMSEIPDETGNQVYVLHAFPKKAPASDEWIEKRLSKDKRISRTDIIEAFIWIDKSSFAFKKIKLFVPPIYKKHICNLQKMAIKHYGYKLEIDYQKNGEQWYLEKVRKEDEFIRLDTIKDMTIPYQAYSELYVNNIVKDSVKWLKGDDVYNGTMPPEIYDLALEHDEKIWENYLSNYPQFSIPDSIRHDMEDMKKLEIQFKEKLFRDDDMPAPVAEKIAKVKSILGKSIKDDYAWLKDTKNPLYNNRVMKYIDAENAYAKNYFIPLRSKQRDLFREMSSLVVKNTKSLPVKKYGYEYYSTFQEDEEYPTIYRRKPGEEAQVLFDINKMSESKSYYQIGGYLISPNNKYVAFTENNDGSDRFVLKFKSLDNNEILADSISSLTGVAWASDASKIYYVSNDTKSLRSYQVREHILGEPVSNDRIIYTEQDVEFSVDISSSKNNEYLFINTSSTNTSETHVKAGTDNDQPFQLFKARAKGIKYHLSYADNKFYITTNAKAKNFKVMATPTNAFDQKNWVTFIEGQKDVMIYPPLILKNYIVVPELKEATSRIKVIDRNTEKTHFVKLKSEISTAWLGYNPDYDTEKIQIIYTDFVTPTITYEYNLKTKDKTILKQDKPGQTIYPRSFKMERVWATARDGKKIPISLFYLKWKNKKEGFRLWLTGYGAYGSGSYPSFSPSVFSLVKKRFVYAIAHVRGGNELGMSWYEDGKMMNKKNSFNDFVDCAEFLIENNYAKAEEIIAEGGSAGGLLMGAVANKRPDLFHTVILNVPFVDVLNTMLDPELPLTTQEYQEWGNPLIKKHFNYIASYSPYDNVKAQDYPNMLFFTGLNDTRVGYWEPAKMAAKLRAMKTDNNLLVLKTNTQSGHGGGSGRWQGLRDRAYIYALVFDLLGRKKTMAEN